MDDGKERRLEIYEDTTSICRDHLRNVCQRAERCKYKHVNLEHLDHLVDTNKDPTSHNCKYVFCHNFQNKGCIWSQCKFIHCSKAIEENYKNNGLLPLRLKYEFEFGVHELCIGSSLGNKVSDEDKPICRNYLKGECHRGKNCRFIHTELTDDDKQMAQKRTWCQMSESQKQNKQHQSFNSAECLKGENNILRQQVSDLKRQVSNLTATNEFLLEQNAKFRYGKQIPVQNMDLYTNIPTMSQTATRNNIPAPTQSSCQTLPLAITFSVAGQSSQVCSNDTAHILGADNQTVITGTELVNTPNPQGSASVVAQPHHPPLQPPQNHLPITRSIPPTIVPNSVTINSTVQINNSIVSPSNTSGTVQQLPVRSNMGNVLTGLTQHAVTLQPTSFPMSHAQNTIHQSQNIAFSMTSQSINNPLSSIASVHAHPSTIIAAAGSLAASNPVPLQQAINQSMAQSSQNLTVANGMVPVPNMTVQTDNDNIVHANQNLPQVAHRQTIVATNQQNQVSAASLTAGGIPGSMAAVAVQVVPQGSMAQTNAFHQPPGMSMASAIVPVTISTSHQMSALVNSGGNIVVQPQVAVAQPHPCVSIATSAPGTNVMASISNGQRQQVMPSMSISGRRIVTNGHQITSPITYTINPSGSVQQHA